MKKIVCLVILLLGLLITACQGKTTTNIETTTTQNQTTTTKEQTTTTQQQLTDECELARAAATDNWEPVWCDEFLYTGSPDSTKWILENKGDGFGNNELQYYTPRLDNAKVENGVLTITVKKEKYYNRNYTSAKLMSRGKGDFLYGKIEVRAKLPKGKGTWPAIWMMPTDSIYGGWPNSGEIDIMEHVGYDMNRIHGTVHTENYNHVKGTQVGKSTVVSDVYNNYHVYAIEWDTNSIKWFVDGKMYHEFKNDENMNPDNSSANWPFDQKFYLILNVAFGGNWGGAQGIDQNFVESRMIVDYVRVYQKNYEAIDEENPSEVKGFKTVDSRPTSTKISWDKATDDVGISHYEVYLDNEYIDNTVAPVITFNHLDQLKDYELKVIAVDFAGKKSHPKTYQFTTGEFMNIPGRIKAADYLQMLGIQLENTSDSDGGKNVGWIEMGDFLVYKVYVKESGNYKVNFRISATQDNREIKLFKIVNNSESLLTNITFNSTGGWQNWQTVPGTQSFYLDEGVILIRVRASNNNFNINWFEFIKEE